MEAVPKSSLITCIKSPMRVVHCRSTVTLCSAHYYYLLPPTCPGLIEDPVHVPLPTPATSARAAAPSKPAAAAAPGRAPAAAPAPAPAPRIDPPAEVSEESALSAVVGTTPVAASSSSSSSSSAAAGAVGSDFDILQRLWALFQEFKVDDLNGIKAVKNLVTSEQLDRRARYVGMRLPSMFPRGPRYSSDGLLVKPLGLASASTFWALVDTRSGDYVIPTPVTSSTSAGSDISGASSDVSVSSSFGQYRNPFGAIVQVIEDLDPAASAAAAGSATVRALLDHPVESYSGLVARWRYVRQRRLDPSLRQPPHVPRPRAALADVIRSAATRFTGFKAAEYFLARGLVFMGKISEAAVMVDTSPPPPPARLSPEPNNRLTVRDASALVRLADHFFTAGVSSLAAAAEIGVPLGQEQKELLAKLLIARSHLHLHMLTSVFTPPQSAAGVKKREVPSKQDRLRHILTALADGMAAVDAGPSRYDSWEILARVISCLRDPEATQQRPLDVDASLAAGLPAALFRVSLAAVHASNSGTASLEVRQLARR